MEERVKKSPGRGARYERDWTKGGIFRNLWSLSWPVLISNTTTMLGPTIDMIWVGRLGAASIAGVGISGIAITVVNSLVMGIFTGTLAMIARFVGAGEEQNANHVAQQAFVIGVAFSIFMAATGIFLAEPTGGDGYHERNDCSSEHHASIRGYVNSNEHKHRLQAFPRGTLPLPGLRLVALSFSWRQRSCFKQRYFPRSGWSHWTVDSF
jgi:hypothetical protein